MRKRRNRLALFSFLVTIFFVFFFRQSLVASSFLRPLAKPTSPAFSLFVTAKFDSIERKEYFLEMIKPVAEFVHLHEPETLSYEVLLSDKDPLRVLIMERYKDKENAYLKVHKSSAPFLEFRKKLQAMQELGQIEISGDSYLDSGVGFGDRTKS